MARRYRRPRALDKPRRRANGGRGADPADPKKPQGQFASLKKLFGG
jgi:hypothetical protein